MVQFIQMPIIKVKIDQTLMDIALQEYGDIDGVFWLVQDNTDLIGITDTLQEGQSLIIREEKIKPKMVEVLKSANIATAGKARGEGIGYWVIGIDFIVT